MGQQIVNKEPTPDTVILLVGTDKNVHLAVDTFLKHYPFKHIVTQINSWKELQAGILSLPKAQYVLFA